MAPIRPGAAIYKLRKLLDCRSLAKCQDNAPSATMTIMLAIHLYLPLSAAGTL